MQQKKRPSVVQVRIIIIVIIIVLWAVVLYVAKWGKNYPKPLGLTFALIMIVVGVLCFVLYNRTLKKEINVL